MEGMPERMKVAFAAAKTRRGYLGVAQPFDRSLAGRLVTLDGRLHGEAEVVALSRISSQHGASHLRSAEPAKLVVGDTAVLLEGPLTVVVGSREHQRQVGLGEVVAYRELRTGARVRGRGRLRRVATEELVGYRGHAFTWALCATGTDDTVDLASTEPPEPSRDEAYWNDLVLHWDRPRALVTASDAAGPEVGDASKSIALLAKMRRQRRSR